MNGKVKFFNQGKGFGFVQADDGREYFVHITGLQPGVVLRENDVVSFDVAEGDRGPKAVNVKISQGKAQEESTEEAMDADESMDDDSEEDEDAEEDEESKSK